MPEIVVLSLHFLEELNKTSKFSVWIDGLWATIWTRNFPDASRESYALKNYVRYEMYRRSIKVLSINCKDMSVKQLWQLILWVGLESGILRKNKRNAKQLHWRCSFIQTERAFLRYEL